MKITILSIIIWPQIPLTWQLDRLLVAVEHGYIVVYQTTGCIGLRQTPWYCQLYDKNVTRHYDGLTSITVLGLTEICTCDNALYHRFVLFDFFIESSHSYSLKYFRNNIHSHLSYVPLLTKFKQSPSVCIVSICWKTCICVSSLCRISGHNIYISLENCQPDTNVRMRWDSGIYLWDEIQVFVGCVISVFLVTLQNFYFDY